MRVHSYICAVREPEGEIRFTLASVHFLSIVFVTRPASLVEGVLIWCMKSWWKRYSMTRVLSLKSIGWMGLMVVPHLCYLREKRNHIQESLEISHSRENCHQRNHGIHPVRLCHRRRRNGGACSSMPSLRRPQHSSTRARSWGKPPRRPQSKNTSCLAFTVWKSYFRLGLWINPSGISTHLAERNIYLRTIYICGWLTDCCLLRT